MEKFSYYDVSFAGLSLGQHDFEFQIAQSFFDLFEFDQDFRDPDLKLQLILDKKNNFLELFFHLSGNIEVDCDLTSDAYREEIHGKSGLIVKFGDEFDDSDDEVWVIPSGEHFINVAQLIYELALLSIPYKRIHPDVLTGKSDSEMLDLIEKYSIQEKEEDAKDSNEEIDPRWEALKKLRK